MVHLKGAAQQVLAALPQSDTIAGARSTAPEWHRRVCHAGQLFGADIWTKTPGPSEEVGTPEPHTEVWGRIARLYGWHSTPCPGSLLKYGSGIRGECCGREFCWWNPRLRSAIVSPHAVLIITSHLCEACSHVAVNCSTVARWFKWFQEGSRSMEYDACTGHPYHYWQHCSCDCVHITWWRQTNDSMGDEKGIRYIENNDTPHFNQISDEEKGSDGYHMCYFPHKNKVT